MRNYFNLVLFLSFNIRLPQTWILALTLIILKIHYIRYVPPTLSFILIIEKGEKCVCMCAWSFLVLRWLMLRRVACGVPLILVFSTDINTSDRESYHDHHITGPVGSYDHIVFLLVLRHIVLSQILRKKKHTSKIFHRLFPSSIYRIS